MNERPNTDDESSLPEDPAPSSDPEQTPRSAKPRASNLKVTPLDEDKNIEKGIEVNET